MRAFKRYSYRGFTLVELMIVVAIIGVLAALAIYGVRRYLASAKTAEAKNSIGAMVRGGVGAFEREYGDTSAISPGTSGLTFNHDICNGTANVVPGPAVAAGLTAVQGKKYTPTMVSGCDYETGDAVSGWKCLKFNMSSPSYYVYGYAAKPHGAAGVGAAFTATGPLSSAAADGFLAQATGDLDGDGIPSAFGMVADIQTSTQQLFTHPELQVLDEYE